MSFEVRTDVELGGRWTSLRDPAGRQWLWHRPDPRRAGVRPGAEFVDVGGVEECFPTLVGAEGEAGAGLDDHGGAWSRPWTQVDADTCEVTVEGLSLRRRIEVGPTITAHYTVVGAPGRSFVWAWHALIDPHPGMQVRADPGPVLDWPDGVDHPPRQGTWPQVGGEPQFDVCAPNDGTARFALLPDRCRVEVGDDLSALVLTLAPDPSSPEVATSIGIWRNLGGYAWDGGPPYRSLGVEPMLGRSPRADGPRADVVTIPASGRVSWTLTISCPPRGIGAGPTPVLDR